ncbi:MAG: Maf family protein [bacterium]
MKPIVLASASPRRAELLERAGIPFEVLSVHFPSELEKIASVSGSVAAGVETTARKKLQRVLAEVSIRAIVVCADTVVAVNGRILGKPSSRIEAVQMLEALSGREHEVFTAVAVADTATGKQAVFHERTVVKFRELRISEIQNYVSTGEPFDKAGAYGIQERASAFIEKVDGCYANVVGLPVARLVSVLKEKMGVDVTEYWKTSGL